MKVTVTDPTTLRYILKWKCLKETS